MLRRDFLFSTLAAVATAAQLKQGEKIAQAARTQIGVTKSYDPAYIHLTYPNGDVDRAKGTCADVVVRACRDALALDLQKLVHEDMQHDFDAYPSHTKWGAKHPDSSIDHRRVLNLEVFWTRANTRLWKPTFKRVAGNEMPGPLQPGDFLTWLLDGHLPHVGIVSSVGTFRTMVIHNWGNGTEETWLHSFAPHVAAGHFRWPA